LYGVPGNKLTVISNGFDEDDFKTESSGHVSHLEPDCIHLTHFGTIYPHFSGRFFPALESLLQEYPAAKQQLRINIIGYPDTDVRQYSIRNSLKDIVRIRGFMNHADALHTMLRSNYLLLFYAHPYISRVCIPGKIYEYLRAGRPILATTFEGGLKELVETGRAGWIVHPEDTEAIKHVLLNILNGGKGRHGTPIPRPEFVEQFRYDRLAAKLASVFDSVLSHGA
jgi:glycosyltransferase involved in cell wall biosynthesis